MIYFLGIQFVYPLYHVVGGGGELVSVLSPVATCSQCRQGVEPIIVNTIALQNYFLDSQLGLA